MFLVNEDTAELVGIFLGDGNIYSSGNNHELRITLNKKEIEYAKFVSRIIEKTFSETPKIRIKKDQNALDIRL